MYRTPDPYYEPLPPHPVDLSCATLNEGQKNWIANEILVGRTSAKRLAVMHNLKLEMILKLVKRKGSGRAFKCGFGRPRALDDKSLHDAETRLFEFYVTYRPNMDDFNSLITGEVCRGYEETFFRRYLKAHDWLINGNNKKIVKIDPKSKKKYFTILKERLTYKLEMVS